MINFSLIRQTKKDIHMYVCIYESKNLLSPVFQVLQKAIKLSKHILLKYVNILKNVYKRFRIFKAKTNSN